MQVFPAKLCLCMFVFVCLRMPRQTRFEAAMPQLLQMLSELLRRNGGGTGEAGDGAEDCC